MSLLIMKMMVMHNDQVIWEELDDMEEAKDHPVGEPPEVRGGYHGKSSGGHLVGDKEEGKFNVLVEYMITNLAMQKSFHEVC